MSEAAVTARLLEILEQLPTHPRSGDLLGALVRAERAGFERGFRTATDHVAGVQGLVLSAFMQRQAD